MPGSHVHIDLDAAIARDEPVFLVEVTQLAGRAFVDDSGTRRSFGGSDDLAFGPGITRQNLTARRCNDELVQATTERAGYSINFGIDT